MVITNKLLVLSMVMMLNGCAAPVIVGEIISTVQQGKRIDKLKQCDTVDVNDTYLANVVTKIPLK